MGKKGSLVTSRTSHIRHVIARTSRRRLEKQRKPAHPLKKAQKSCLCTRDIDPGCHCFALSKVSSYLNSS